MGHIVGGHQRLIDADRRPRRRARRRHPRRRPASRGSRSTDGARDRRRWSTARRRALRPDDRHAAAARARASCCRSASARCSTPTRSATSASSAWSSRCAARCCPTTRSTSAIRRRSPRSSRPRTWSAPTTPTGCASSTCRKYCDADAPEQTEDDECDLRPLHRDAARACRPTSADEDVVDWTVQRAPLVEPVHALRARSRASRPSGPAWRAWRWPRQARSTRGCSTATRSIGFAEGRRRGAERLALPGTPAARHRWPRRLSRVPGREPRRSSCVARSVARPLSRIRPASTSARNGRPARPHQPAHRHLVGDGRDDPAALPRLHARRSARSQFGDRSTASTRAPRRSSGVAGGFVADRWRRHKEVAAAGYGALGRLQAGAARSPAAPRRRSARSSSSTASARASAPRRATR